MTKDEVSKYVKEAYPSYVKKMTSLEEGLLSALNWYNENRPDLIKTNDFRPGTLSRLLSSIISVRFYLDRTSDFFSNDSWDNDYTEKYIPNPWKGNGNFGHFKDLDLTTRFYLFHSIYHQLETTIRVICKELKLEKKIKPIERVNEVTSTFPADFLILIDAIRNSIHNNGYYFPIGKQAKEFKYRIESLEFVFKDGEKVTLDTQETLLVIREILKYVETLLHHKSIEELPVIRDLS